MKTIISIISLIFMSSICYASDNDKLIKISENKYQTVYGVKNSLKFSGQYSKMWTIVKYKKGASKIIFKGDFPTMTEHAQQWAFDCEQNKIKSLSLDIYNKNGVIIYSEGESDANDVIPGTLGEELISVACYQYDQLTEKTQEKIEEKSL